MASCTQLMNNIINNGTIAKPLDAIINITIDFDNSELFEYELKSYSNMTMNIISDYNPNATLSIYDSNGKLFSTTPIRNNITQISNNLPRGKHYFCFSSKSFTKVNMKVTTKFENREEPVIIDYKSYYGTSATCKLKVPDRPPIVIDKDVDMEIVEGYLPDGLTMNGLGVITGRINEMDCSEHTKDNSASFDFYNEMDEYTTMSWGKLWRFKVKAWLSFAPDTKPIYRWFCIKVFNNWSNDRDDFMSRLMELNDIIVNEKVLYTDPTKEKLTGLCVVPCEELEDIISPPKLVGELESNCPIDDDDDVDVVSHINVDNVIVPPVSYEYVMNGYNNVRLRNDYIRFKAYLLDTPVNNIDSDNFVINIRSCAVLNKMIDYQLMTDIRKYETGKDYYINYNETGKVLEFAEFDRISEHKPQTDDFSEFDPLSTLEWKSVNDIWDEIRKIESKKNPMVIHAWYGYNTDAQITRRTWS